MSNQVSADQYRALQRRNTDLQSQLEKSQKELLGLKDASRKWKQGYDYYMMIQTGCANSPAAAMQLEDLLVTVRLSCDDDIPGLTSEGENHDDQYDLYRGFGLS